MKNLQEQMAVAEERQRIWKLLKKHRGAVSELGRRAGVAPQTVNSWLNGAQSRPIEEAARKLVLDIDVGKYSPQ